MKSGFGLKGGKINSNFGLKSLNDQYSSIVKYFRDRYGSDLAILVDFSKGYTTNPVSSINDQASNFVYPAIGTGPSVVDQNGYQTLNFTGGHKFKGTNAYSSYSTSAGITIIVAAKVNKTTADNTSLFVMEDDTDKNVEWGTGWMASGSLASFGRSWYINEEGSRIGGNLYGGQCNFNINTGFGARAIKIQKNNPLSLSFVSTAGGIVRSGENNNTGSFATGSYPWPPNFHFPIGSGIPPLYWDSYVGDIKYFMLAVVANYVSDANLKEDLNFLINYYKFPSNA